jgi:hypothetical protein
VLFSDHATHRLSQEVRATISFPADLGLVNVVLLYWSRATGRTQAILQPAGIQMYVCKTGIRRACAQGDSLMLGMDLAPSPFSEIEYMIIEYFKQLCDTVILAWRKGYSGCRRCYDNALRDAIDVLERMAPLSNLLLSLLTFATTIKCT